MNPSIDKTMEILLVEDNPADVELTIEAFKARESKSNISVVTDGQMAINYLQKNAGFEEAITPDLVLLDLNLPKLNGREVLNFIKNSADLNQIPVIILTTSESHQDIRISYELHANCYITKPVDFNKFLAITDSIENFWFKTVKLPSTY